MEDNWDHQDGWVDTLDTVCAYTGLFSYYVEYEKEARRLRRSEVRRLIKDFASKVKFKFHSRASAMQVRPVWSGRKFRRDEHSCYVLMPLSKPWSSELKRLIKQALKSYGVQALVADDQYGQEVMEDVWKGINSAATIIADCGGGNANVFYELGIVHTVGRQTILLAQTEQDIPFDVGQFRHVRYSVTKDEKLNLEEQHKFRNELGKHLSACMKTTISV